MIVPLAVGLFLLYSFRGGNMETRSVNGESFRIQMRDDAHISKRVARDLYEIKVKVDKLLLSLRKKVYTDETRKEAVQRLLMRYKGVIQEIPESRWKRVAYNENKGDMIALCMYKDGEHQDQNTAMFVVLHELAHCMTKEYKHNDKFWDNFKFLLKESIQLGIYYYQDFSNNSENFCGMEISNTPYKI